MADREDYFSAEAECEVEFLREGAARALTEDQGSSKTTVSFPQAARGCATVQAFDEDRNRNIYRLESLLTVFHADDERPGWVRAISALAMGKTPGELPRPVEGVASRLLRNYGPGSITVIQDPNRPVLGEVVAGTPGRDGDFFPAHSYFDQYLMVKVGGRTYVNKEPLRVSGEVNTWPPQGETYRSERVTPFWDVENLDGDPVFNFGKCTIRITTELEQEQRRGLHEMVEVLRAS